MHRMEDGTFKFSRLVSNLLPLLKGGLIVAARRSSTRAKLGERYRIGRQTRINKCRKYVRARVEGVTSQAVSYGLSLSRFWP
jgi:hypothetical protein